MPPRKRADAHPWLWLGRRALSPTSLQATHLSHLFAHPDTPIRLTDPAATASKNLPAPPEIVTNVQGSSAGAGSGEFHVYKAARRREYERLRAMDEEVVREKEAEEFEEKRRERERLDEEKTRKNREKREKKRLKGKGTGKSGATTDGKEEKKGGVVARKDGEKDWDEKGDDVGGARPVAAAVVDAGPGLVIHDDD
ncbi:hypothetical protein B0T16DRAFT_386725 [Cercophora newfieldiana]|uniref:DUF1168-domain-containing protein n=1 Tax=Cercophora newfieldiana TaxID=92897 RepID=A0AA40CW12_9PEZI|nr:hypothetical protein B0T16DRAFT_386725 [Cercophora newfieldiana]